MVSRKAVINGSTVENVILADDDFELPDRLLVTLPEGSTVAPGWTYDGEDFAPPVVPLADLVAAKIAAINAKADALLSAGCPVGGGLHVAVDDGSRADMGAMATTALAALSSAVPWPASYQTGWIAIENVRVPLPTPGDGLALAAGVGDYYAQVRQNGRNMKDAAAAAEDLTALDAIDIEQGWPE